MATRTTTRKCDFSDTTISATQIQSTISVAQNDYHNQNLENWTVKCNEIRRN